MLLSDAAIINHVLNGDYLEENQAKKSYVVTIEECTRYQIKLDSSDKKTAEQIAQAIFCEPEFKKFFVKASSEVKIPKNHNMERIRQEFSRWY